MKFPTPCMRLIAGTIAVLLIAACEDASVSSPARSDRQPEFEAEFRRAQQSLEQSKKALGDAQRQLSALRSEQTRDSRRIADLTARSLGLERQNREMGRRLARTRGQLAQISSVHQALRQQRDQNARRVHELSNEQQPMRARLASADSEIRQLQARQATNQRQITDLYHRGAAAARELDELRKFNGFLLQERSNLQAWLQEANSTRSALQDALRKSAQEADRIKAEAATSNQELRAERDQSNQVLAQLRASRDTLAEETDSLRATLVQATETESMRGEQLAKALAHAATLADANERLATELQSSQNTADQPRRLQDNGIDDAGVLRAELERSASKIAKLQAANDYLVDKIEACALQQRSSRAESTQQATRLALLSNPPRGQGAADFRQRLDHRFMTTRWHTGATVESHKQPRPIAVADQDADEPKSTRREKELEEAKDKARRLQQEQAALAKKLEELEAENAAVKKQVQTLTWANEVLVKELDAAYAARETASPDSLPKGARGIYMLRKGESLSRVASAFYGDPKRWKDLVEANKEKIPDPDMVKAGTVILIPE